MLQNKIQMVNLVIVDGSNYIYRAYYSHKDFKNSKGEPTYGIFEMFEIRTKLEELNSQNISHNEKVKKYFYDF